MIGHPKARRRDRNYNPGFRTYYFLGVQYSKGLDTYCTLRELAELFGVTHQNAYTETVVALGKLIFRLRRQTAEPSAPLRLCGSKKLSSSTL